MKKIAFLFFFIFYTIISAQTDTSLTHSGKNTFSISVISGKVFTVTPSDINNKFRMTDGISSELPLYSSSEQFNTASIYQEQDNNQASITQSGNGLSSSARQIGNGNSIVQNSHGSNIHTEVEQIGDNNKITQDLDGSDYFFKLGQYGSNNVISQYESGATPRQYEVTQTGNDLKLIISNGSFTPN